MSENFYCQNVCGDVDFSIDEWNTAYEEVKDMSEEIQRLVLDPPPRCEKQCFNCMAIVGERRVLTKKIMQKEPKKYTFMATKIVTTIEWDRWNEAQKINPTS